MSFLKHRLGKITTEDGDNVVVDVLSHDSLQIEEYNGDFIVMDGFRNLIHIQVRGCYHSCTSLRWSYNLVHILHLKHWWFSINEQYRWSSWL